MTKEQLEDEIKKIKQAHADDEGTYHFKNLSNIFFLGSLIVIEGKDFLYMGWVLFEEHKTSYVMLVFFFVNWLLIYAIFSLPFI